MIFIYGTHIILNKRDLTMNTKYFYTIITILAIGNKIHAMNPLKSKIMGYALRDDKKSEDLMRRVEESGPKAQVNRWGVSCTGNPKVDAVRNAQLPTEGIRMAISDPTVTWAEFVELGKLLSERNVKVEQCLIDAAIERHRAAVITLGGTGVIDSSHFRSGGRDVSFSDYSNDRSNSDNHESSAGEWSVFERGDQRDNDHNGWSWSRDSDGNSIGSKK